MFTGQSVMPARPSGCPELLPDQERVLGPEHPDTLKKPGANIRLSTGQGGDAREALRLFQELLPDQERVLGAGPSRHPRHPEQHRVLTGQSGDARGALRLFQELLPDQERVLGADHPDTLRTREWIESAVGSSVIGAVHPAGTQPAPDKSAPIGRPTCAFVR